MQLSVQMLQCKKKGRAAHEKSGMPKTCSAVADAAERPPQRALTASDRFHTTGRRRILQGMRALARGLHLDLSDYFPYLINRVGSALVQRFSEDALAGTHLNIATWRV